MNAKNLILVMSLIFHLLIAGCGPKSVDTEPRGDLANQMKGAGVIFYPPLPNAPKYQYLTTFSTSEDVQKKKSKFFKFVAGNDAEKPKEIKKAYGVGIYDGIIYTCDLGNSLVVTLDLKKNAFGYIGFSGVGKLAKPVNLKIDKKNKLLFVADIGRKQVVCFDLQGNVVKVYGLNNQFHPSAVEVDKNKLFVCDVQGHQIHVLDIATGETLYKIGKPGSREGELFHPTNICIEGDRLYVTDTNNFRFQVFDLQGKFIASYGKIGDRAGDFSRPKGIAVDKEGRIYVVDAAFENVQVFNPQFKLLLFMLGPGREKHNVNLPAGIAVDYDDVNYFKKYLAPGFEAQYILLVTSNFGANKVNVYAFGNYRQK